jgi:hypothetical protein
MHRRASHVDVNTPGAMDMNSTEAFAISGITQNVARFSFRDEARWEELRDLFLPGGHISLSWYNGPINGFIEASRLMAGSPDILTKHWLGTPRIEINGKRALSEVDVAIKVRSRLGLFDVDLTSFARFFDQFELCDDARWRISRRVAIYEQDRIDPVQPSVLFWLLYRLARFQRYPVALRHLAFGLARKGQSLAGGIVTAQSEEEKSLKQAANIWLIGKNG